MKRLFQRGLALLALVFGVFLQLAAQSAQINITMQDGSEQAFMLSHTDRIYFEDNTFLVLDGDILTKNEVKIALADIRKITCGEFVGLEEDEANAPCVYPNPVHDVLTLSNLGEVQPVSIYAIDGRLVKSLETNGEQPIDVSGLPIGVYLVKTQSATLKMIKL